MTLPIIKLGITKEVEKTSNASTLFRGNTMATKLMTAFTRLTGRSYLASTLKPQLDAIAQDVANGKILGSLLLFRLFSYKSRHHFTGMGFEVDPSKVGSGESVEVNMQNLKNYCQRFLQAIIDSFSRCPLPFRVMAAHLRNEVVKSFPEAKYSWYVLVLSVLLSSSLTSSPIALAVSYSCASSARLYYLRILPARHS